MNPGFVYYAKLILILKTYFPFILCNNTELANINDSNSMRIYELLPNHDSHILSKFCELEAKDVNHELPSRSNSNYYSVKEFQKLEMSKNFNIFHTNINGLENKFDLLHEFISNSDSNFDISGITETSQKSNKKFRSVIILSYNMYSTLSRVATGPGNPGKVLEFYLSWKNS